MNKYAAIYAAAKEAGLDEDARRDVFERVSGKRSLRAMDGGQRAAVAAEMRRLVTGTGMEPAEPKAHVRMVLALWWKLANAGLVAKDTADGKARKAALNAFIRADTFRSKWGDVPTHYRFLSVARAADVIEALKAIGRRGGVELDR